MSLPELPEGRLSMRKLRAFADAVNAELHKQGATRFVEIGSTYGHYTFHELTPAQYRWRCGDRDEAASSAVATTVPGLTAKQAEGRIVDHYRKYATR